MTKQNLQSEYSNDYLLLKIMQEAMYFAFSTWTMSLAKFNHQIQDFKHVLDLICKKKEDSPVRFILNWLSNIKNLVISNGPKNVQNMIQNH